MGRSGSDFRGLQMCSFGVRPPGSFAYARKVWVRRGTAAIRWNVSPDATESPRGGCASGLGQAVLDAVVGLYGVDLVWHGFDYVLPGRSCHFATVFGLLPNSGLSCESQARVRCSAALTAGVVAARP